MEAELVGVSDYIPYNIWLTNFMKEQGYVFDKNIVYQDNKSAILMEKNGRNSCTGNSRHIDIRYFFVKDRVNKNEIEIVHCPTDMMLADFYTKALQGSLFKKYRDVIMGYADISTLKQSDSTQFCDEIKEHVEDNEVISTHNMQNKQNNYGKTYAEVLMMK